MALEKAASPERCSWRTEWNISTRTSPRERSPLGILVSRKWKRTAPPGRKASACSNALLSRNLILRLKQLSASVVTQNRPMRVTSKPANEKARDIDSDGSPYRLLRYEQCLERSEETTSFGTREARMALAAHRASHWCTSRNSRRLPEGGGDRGTTNGWLGTASTGKTGQRGDHRPR